MKDRNDLVIYTVLSGGINDEMSRIRLRHMFLFFELSQ